MRVLMHRGPGKGKRNRFRMLLVRVGNKFWNLLSREEVPDHIPRKLCFQRFSRVLFVVH